jgi:hypothetical protein
MKNATYLMNSTKMEYIYLGAGFPEMVGKHLLILEKLCGWNLHRDDIAVRHVSATLGYKNVSDCVYTDVSTGGEVIHEMLGFY